MGWLKVKYQETDLLIPIERIVAVEVTKNRMVLYCDAKTYFSRISIECDGKKVDMLVKLMDMARNRPAVIDISQILEEREKKEERRDKK